MPDFDFSKVRPNSLLLFPTSPRPLNKDFRGLLLNVPPQAVLTSPGASGPAGSSPLRLVISLSLTYSLFDQRRFAADGHPDPLAGICVVVSDQSQGFAAAGRLRLPSVRNRPDLMPEVSEAEAKRTVMTNYANPNLPDIVPLPARAGSYAVFLTLASWQSPVLTMIVTLPDSP